MRTFFAFLALCFTASAVLAAPRHQSAVSRHQLPFFDIEHNCSLEAQDSGNVQQTKAECVKDENDAKKELDQRWSKLAESKAKSQCLEESRIGGDQSYMELLTCLKMSTDWTSDHTTVGQAPSNNQPPSNGQTPANGQPSSNDQHH